jgi:hypothetical protein
MYNFTILIINEYSILMFIDHMQSCTLIEHICDMKRKIYGYCITCVVNTNKDVIFNSFNQCSSTNNHMKKSEI